MSIIFNTDVLIHRNRVFKFSTQSYTNLIYNCRHHRSILSHTYSKLIKESKRLSIISHVVNEASDNSVTKSRQQTRISTSTDVPTWFERLSAALMFLLPCSEGLYRFCLVSVKFCKKYSLEFLFWCHLQLKHVSFALASKAPTDFTTEDVLALQTLMQMSQQLHKWFNTWSDQLLNLSLPVAVTKSGTYIINWAKGVFTTPEALWQIFCLVYMSIMAAIASFKFARLRDGREDKFKKFRLFRKPEIVTASYFCAILMRVSWSPMEGMSDLSLDLYCLGATLLTLITSGCCLGKMHHLLFLPFGKISQFIENMVQEATSVAQLHRSFLFLDWVLCLFSKVSVETKCLRSLLLMVYWLTVNALEGETQSLKQAPTSS